MNLDNILKNHKKWVADPSTGRRGDLSESNLSGADLRGADLSGADLSGADLRGADLSGADLHGADLLHVNLNHGNLNDVNLEDTCLEFSNLSYANLTGANLRSTVLTSVNFIGALLCNVNFSQSTCCEVNFQRSLLCGANLSRSKLLQVNFYGADLQDTLLNDLNVGLNVTFFYPQCPMEGSFIAYKQAYGRIIVLEIPADAERSSATTLQCRANKAKILRIENLDGTIAPETSVESNYDSNFLYTVGEIVTVTNWEPNRWKECCEGIHFFMARECAVSYLQGT